MTWLRLFSSTTKPGHRVRISMFLSSNAPAFSTNSNNAANSRGVRLRGHPSREPAERQYRPLPQSTSHRLRALPSSQRSIACPKCQPRAPIISHTRAPAACPPRRVFAPSRGQPRDRNRILGCSWCRSPSNHFANAKTPPPANGGIWNSRQIPSAVSDRYGPNPTRCEGVLGAVIHPSLSIAWLPVPTSGIIQPDTRVESFG